ncbi:uncharacterized protein KGF55_002892 [Candida pseudojiufengensis]|uniref:uncharacterized protein n=1 Tax=Candida pseudojiufengensis TaxID=497109 RepID=UPI0022252FC8|nr:uncharacterized protein KGF55_002892 [Candida pseudojiufengensis]KAI5963100.1 hypothetical protein KGF55_002892 [Candida pseudojiufengensis]
MILLPCFILLIPLSIVLSDLIPPDQDPFYNPPKGFELEPLGSILKNRTTPNKLNNLFFTFDVKNSWQLMYRSSNSFDQAAVVVMTVIEPFNASTNKVLSYQTFQDSANFNCCPSYGFQNGAPISTLASQLDMRFFLPALRKGYYVISSDYEGVNSSFAVGRTSGYAVLDGIRAATNSRDITGIEPSAKFVLFGYSGGSLASSWAISLQPKYAPDLKNYILGCAMGGLVTNITATAEATDGSTFSGLIPLALNGLCNEYENFKEIVYSKIKSSIKLLNFKEATSKCFVTGLITYQNMNFFNGENRTFEDGFSILDIPIISQIIESNNLINLNSSYLPQVPIFIYHGTLDDIVPISGVYKIYKKWCDWGIKSLEFSESLLNGHITEQIFGAAAAITWIDNIFNGFEGVKGCSHTKRLSNLWSYPNITDETKNYFLSMDYSILDFILGKNFKVKR